MDSFLFFIILHRQKGAWVLREQTCCDGGKKINAIFTEKKNGHLRNTSLYCKHIYLWGFIIRNKRKKKNTEQWK